MVQVSSDNNFNFDTLPTFDNFQEQKVFGQLSNLKIKNYLLWFP